jgi:hypothetical protein
MLEIGKETILLRDHLREKDQADNQWRCYEGVLDFVFLLVFRWSLCECIVFSMFVPHFLVHLKVKHLKMIQQLISENLNYL